MDSIRSADDVLIDLIYAAMLGEASWQMFLDQLSASSPGGCSVLFSYDEIREEGFVGLYAGCEDDVVDSFESYYSALNPLAPHCAVRKPGIGLISHEIYPQEKLIRTEYYNDFMLKIGLKSAAGCTIAKDVDRTFVISTVTVDDEPEIISPIADQFTRIAPHLKRAADFYRKGPKLQAMTELGGSLFDAVHIGMMVIGEGRRVKAISDTMQRAIRETSPIQVSPVGRISLPDENANVVLNQMLQRAYLGPKSVSFPCRGGQLTLVHVRKDRLSFYFEGPTVILLYERSQQPGDGFDLEGFSAVHGLTFAERRALDGLLSGMNAGEIAESAGLSRETIRSQMKGLYLKTGVHSEAELLRVIFGLTATRH